jgi:hypothetical protein
LSGGRDNGIKNGGWSQAAKTKTVSVKGMILNAENEKGRSKKHF